MTDREQFIEWCQLNNDSWIVCNVPNVETFKVWLAATLVEREKHNIETFKVQIAVTLVERENHKIKPLEEIFWRKSK